MRFSFIAILFIIFSAAFAMPMPRTPDEGSQSKLFQKLPDSVRKKELTTPAEIEPYQQKFFEAEGAKKVLRSNSEYSYAFIESEGYVIDKLCGTEETKLGPLYTSLEKDYGVRLIAWWRDQKLDNCGFIVAHTVESAEKLGLLPV